MVSSGAIMPARAPPSMVMLHMVMRRVHGERADGFAGIFEDVAGAAGDADLADEREDDVLRRDAFGALAVEADQCMVFDSTCSRHCVASTCSTSLVPMPKASAPNAPCVEVWLSPQTMVCPGCVMPSSGPMTCTMP